MMPVSGYMDTNPHMRNQVPYPQHYFPGFEPHYKADASMSPMLYESWPCSSRYPVPYHGCCNHGNFPGYYSYRPPCPQFAPSPAFRHYPNYPSYPEPYPVYYAPPPHYLNEQPRYEYDKDLHANYHCCGCPNHLHNQKNDRGSKIEERGNNAEKMQGDSVVPVQPRSFPYPIVWIPPEHMNSREHGKQNDRMEASGSNEAPCLVRPSKSLRPTEVTEQQPRNGWFPIDMNGLKSLMQGQGETQSQNQQNKDLMMQFPFPMFRVPYSDRKQEEGESSDQRRMIAASDHSEQAPVNIEPYVSDAKIDKPQLEKEFSRDKNAAGTKEASARQKCVPVQVQEAKSEGTEDKGRDEAVKRAEDTTKNAVGTTKKRESPSPKKTSKLPPICLRVDPLPKKRNGNGSSRSPSPPKGQSEGTTTKASTALKEDSAINTRNMSCGLENVEPGEHKRKDIPVIEERSKENNAGEVNTHHRSSSLGNVEPGEKKRKDIPVIEERSKENKAGEVNTQHCSGSLGNLEPGEKKRNDIPVIEERSKESKGGEVNTQHCSGSLGNVEPGEKKRKDIPVIEERSKENKAGETTGASQTQVSVNSKDETKLKFEEVAGDEKEAASVKASNPVEPAKCKEVKRMSGHEAAKLIQSAFRGFEVRRWEPLKKLKQIADVREQVDEVKNRIQFLESSSGGDKDDKFRLLIGEKIMSLLLRLDTIQGFDSSVRNTRKSLVKELVILQERLDSLTSKWAEEKAKDFGKAESADFPCGRTSENVSMEKESENALAALEDINENANVKEPEEECLAHILDGKDDETTVAKTDKNNIEVTSAIECHTAEPRIDGEDVLPTLEHSMSSATECHTAAQRIDEVTSAIECHTAEPRIDGEDVLPTLEHSMSSATECHTAAQRIDGEDVLPTLEHSVSYVPEQKLNADDIMEVNDQILVDSNSEDDKLRSLNRANKMDVDCEPVTEIGNNNGEINLSLPDEENLRCTEEVQVINLLKELPVGVIDEEPANAQDDEHLPEAESNKSVKDEKENKFTDNPELEIEMNLKEVVNLSLPDEEENLRCTEKVQVIDLLKELPVGVIDEEPAISQDDEHLPEAESNRSVKDENPELEIEMNQKEVNNDSKSEEEVHSTAGEEHNDELQQHEDDLGATPADLAVTPESEARSDATKEKQVLFEEQKGAEKDGVLSESHAEEGLEHELAKIGEDDKLIEENKRLKEMMEKLMEVGKDQLTVISNLTERVKDLEQKLTRTKKSSKPGKRKLRYASSCYKPAKAKNWVAQVAM